MPGLAFKVVIPARYASTRLPAKPLLDLGGKPMVVRVAERAHLSGAEEIWVATDHPEVRAAAEAHEVAALMTRSDHQTGTDRLAEVVEQRGWPDDTIIVNVQGDEPLIDPQLIRQCADLLRAADDCVAATAAHPITTLGDYLDPNIVKVVLDARQRALYFSRAPIPWRRDGAPQALPQQPPALRHVGLYAYRAGFLRGFPRLPPAGVEQVEALEQLRVLWHGERIAVHVSQAAPGIGVDTPQDLERVRALFR